jgi:hypothetical protein
VYVHLSIASHRKGVHQYQFCAELIHIGMMVPDNGLSIDEFIQQSPQLSHAQETYKYAAYDGLGNLSGHKLCEG